MPSMPSLSELQRFTHIMLDACEREHESLATLPISDDTQHAIDCLVAYQQRGIATFHYALLRRKH